MKTYHWNGENWYSRNWSLLHHIRHWFIWFGGWEKANGEGWKILRRHNGKFYIASITPVTIFGSRVTFYSWGFNIRIGYRWLVFSKFGGKRKIYLSVDGTPNNANSWWYGTPNNIVNESQNNMENQ